MTWLSSRFVVVMFMVIVLSSVGSSLSPLAKVFNFIFPFQFFYIVRKELCYFSAISSESDLLNSRYLFGGVGGDLSSRVASYSNRASSLSPFH